MIQKINEKAVTFTDFVKNELPALGRAVFYTEVSNDRNDWRPIETLDEYKGEQFISVSCMDLFSIWYKNFKIIEQ